MASTGNLNRRLGSRSIHSAIPFLEAFWKAYKVCHPDFSLYYREDVDLGSCIPVYIYADGGRGLEKTKLMVFNWSSAVGYGSGKQRASRRKFGRGRSNHPQVNLIGHSYTNRKPFFVGCDATQMTKMIRDSMLCSTLSVKTSSRATRKGSKLETFVFALWCWDWRRIASCKLVQGGLPDGTPPARNPFMIQTKKKQTIGYCCWLCPAGHINYPTIPLKKIHTERPRWLEVIDEFALVEECGLLVRSFPYIAHPAKFYLPDLFQSISYIYT